MTEASATRRAGPGTRNSTSLMPVPATPSGRAISVAPSRRGAATIPRERPFQ